MTTAFIAWAKGPNRTVINCGEFAMLADAIAAAEASPLGMAEVEAVYRPDITAAPYAWIIDRDYCPDGEPGTNLNAKGVTGPRGVDAASLTALAGGFGARFRMFDDDGHLTYSGRLLGDPDSEDGFAPLDDFGMPNAGCTYIEYLDADTGEWNQL